MNQEKIGNFIAAMRKEKGLTQAQLAERLGVINKTVSRWETGKNMPDYAVLEDLTQELGITVNELIRGEKIMKEAIIQEYDHNLVEVLKEYKRMKKAKNTMLTILLILTGATVWLAAMLLLTLGLPYLENTSSQIEINEDISRYHDYIGQDALDDYRNKFNMDESIFPSQITDDMTIIDYKMVFYSPWDSQYLSYLVINYNEDAWNKELSRLEQYPSTEYTGYYNVTGFSGYELLAMYADDYYGFVYALADRNSQQIIYVELLFCNYFMDIDYSKYIPSTYLPDGFDATIDNTYRREKLK